MAETPSKIEGSKPSSAPTPPLSSHQPDNPPSPAPPVSAGRSSAGSAFAFWTYLSLFVSLVAFLLPSLSPSPSSDGGRSWFLSLPDDLRLHHARGKLIKAHAAAATLQVFAVEVGPPDGDAVLLLHGLGCSSFSFRRVLPSLASGGLRAVAVDLPGSGFSDPLPDGDRRWTGSLGWIVDVYNEIKEKGIFWAFDQLVETGQMPYDQIGVRVSGNDGDASSDYGPAEIGRFIGQVIDSMGLAPVHLVLHDSVSPAALNWASWNSGSVRSVTLIDSSAESAAFPSRIIGTPVLGPLLLRSRFMFSWLLRLCCSRSMDESSTEAYRLLLKGEDGRKATVATGKALNYTFDLEEWTRLEAIKDLPLHVLWSNMWSDRWIDEGKRISTAAAMGKFVYHSGGRWPQEDAPEEISSKIVQFISSLPKLPKETKEEPLPEHIERLLKEATDAHHDNHHHDHHHHHHYHGHGHGYDHDHAADYTDIYGAGQRWGL